MKVLCRLLYAEARQTGTPIVYLGHPQEFGPWNPHRRLRRSDLSLKMVRAHGLLIRKNLCVVDREMRLQMNRGLFSYMSTLPGVQFMTMHEYVLYFERSNGCEK